MRPAIAALLERLQSTSASKNDAILPLALLLERSTRWGNTDATHESELPRELLDNALSDAEHSEIVHTLGRAILHEPENGSLYWALGKAKWEEGMGVLLRTLATRGDEIGEEPAYQAIIALENFLIADGGRLLVGVQQEFEASDPRPFLESCLLSSQPRLSALSRRLLARIARG